MEASALSILVPAFDEEPGIGAALAALSAEPRLAGAQVIVIDDGSTDRTAAIAAAAGAVEVVRHERNRGYGAAIKTGIRSSRRALIAWYDADGQHRAGDLADMVARLEEETLDAVLGARARPATRLRSAWWGSSC